MGRLIRAASRAYLGLVSGSSVDAPLQKAMTDSGLVEIPAGTFPISAAQPPAVGKILKGRPGQTILDAPANNGANLLNFYGANNLKVSGLVIRQNKSGTTDNGHGLVLQDASNCVVEDVRVEGIGGTGTGVIQYNTNGGKTERVVYRNLDVIGLQAISSNTNGAIIVDAYWSRMSGIYAKGIHDFPVEWKNDCRYGVLSDVQIQDSRTGLYHGTVTADNPSLIASANVVIKGADFGVSPGLGTDNIYANILVDSTGTTYGAPEGIRHVGQRSSVWGLHMVGAEITYGVRYNDQANSNYTKVSAHHTKPNIVTLQATSKRNVTEIAHPGARDSLLNASVYANANAAADFSGSNANPTFCHATGQYFGTFSRTWEWRLFMPDAVAPLSTDTWRYTTQGQNGHVAILGSDNFAYGLAVVTPNGRKHIQYDGTLDAWMIQGKTTQYRAGLSDFRVMTDNAVALGTAAYRWSVVYAGTATIATSDERQKQQIGGIDAAVLRAWSRVDYCQYKFNDAVAEKGDGARWHFGVIAQRVKAAFEAEGLDAFAYGVLCFDEWPDQYETDEDGTVRLVRAAGNRYGIRYEEALVLECAYLRSRLG